MDDARIAEIKKRLAEATPQPWMYMELPKLHEWRLTKFFIGAVPYEGHPYKGHICYFDVAGEEEYPTRTGDLKLIANAPADIAWLLARLEEQARENYKLMQTINSLAGGSAQGLLAHSKRHAPQ